MPSKLKMNYNICKASSLRENIRDSIFLLARS
jgi:hypothetical protein